MSRLTWTKEARKEARELGRYLVKLQVHGVHAEDGPIPGCSISTTGTLSAEQAYAAMAILQLTSFGEEAIRALPESKKAPTREALRELLELLE